MVMPGPEGNKGNSRAMSSVTAVCPFEAKKTPKLVVPPVRRNGRTSTSGGSSRRRRGKLITSALVDNIAGAGQWLATEWQVPLMKKFCSDTHSHSLVGV
ncbi:unnamed protein product [Amoebophrya sp. A25]|nr:unnamed protein product [Amoebophrya sp. A25]|eukprot:GSA25T00002849001.1